MKPAPYLSTLTLFKASLGAVSPAWLAGSLLALQAGVLPTSAAVPDPVGALIPAPAWSPKIRPGPKHAPGGDKRPKPPFQPCHPNPRAFPGGI